VAESLLRGDVVSAWLANPLALVVVALVVARAVGWVVEIVRTPAGPPRRWLPASVAHHWFAVSVALAVVYVLARNLLPLG
jgi:hypothetical protein